MEVPDELRVALELAQRTSVGKGNVAKFATEMTRILERAIIKIEYQNAPSAIGRPAKGYERVVYVVDQDRGHGESLAEHRTSGKSKAFRCPKRVYDALAAALAAADRPLGLDEIITAVEKLLGDRPADHQVRVAMRLWMHVDPALVSRNRARYRAVLGDDLGSKASSLWADLRPKK